MTRSIKNELQTHVIFSNKNPTPPSFIKIKSWSYSMCKNPYLLNILRASCKSLLLTGILSYDFQNNMNLQPKNSSRAQRELLWLFRLVRPEIKFEFSENCEISQKLRKIFSKRSKIDFRITFNKKNNHNNICSCPRIIDAHPLKRLQLLFFAVNEDLRKLKYPAPAIPCAYQLDNDTQPFKIPTIPASTMRMMSRSGSLCPHSEIGSIYARD